MTWRSRLGPLRERDFRFLFLGRTVALFGTAIANVALAFAVLDLTGSASDLGVVLAANVIPQVLFVLVGGIWADRLPRHHVMVATDFVNAAAQAATAAVLLTGVAEIWQLIALQALRGTASAFFWPASIGIVPQTVTGSLLQQANAILRLSVNATTISGYALAGLIVAGIGPGWSLAIDAATFVASGILLSFLRIPRSAHLPARDFVGELREGWDEFRSRKWLWAIVVQFAFVNAFASGSFRVLGPVVSEESLDGAASWGLILTGGSLGLVIGGVLTLRFRPERLLLAASLAIFLMAPQFLLLAEAAPVLAIAFAALLAGIGAELFGVFWDTALQQQIPQERLSRVSAYDMLGSIVFIPVGFAIAGPISELIGVEETLWSSAALVVVATLAVLCVTDVRTLRRLEPAAT